jgi:phosphoglycolate phosphatase-like HAD superfamily hydrolase
MTSYANCTHALCLFKDYRTNEIFVIAGKGCFAELDQKKDVEAPEWVDLTSFESESKLMERLAQLRVKVPTFETRPSAAKGLDLGDVMVDLEKLLAAGTVSDDDLKILLADKAFDILALACKSRGEMAGLRAFLSNQKVEVVSIQLEDVSGAAAIISQLGKEGLTEMAKSELQSKLRAAHAANREHYMLGKRSDARGEAARGRNRLVDGALRTVADVEKAGYTADILSRSSNRARRADVVSADQVETAALDFDAPAFKGECEVCCGEDEVMSIALKVLTPEEMAVNTVSLSSAFSSLH